MPDNRYNDAVHKLASLLDLSEDAIVIAQGWSVLPESLQRHFTLVIDDYIANVSPTLRELYGNARQSDQLRFNRIIERIQDRKRGIPPEHDA